MIPQYKPGWSISARELDSYAFGRAINNSHHVELTISYRALDANNPDKDTTVTYVRPIFIEAGAITDPAAVRALIADAIREAEEHETDEWLRFNSARYKEPHP